MLELMKVGAIKAVQDDNVSDILIEFVEEKMFNKEDYKSMGE